MDITAEMPVRDRILVKETKQIVYKENPTYLWDEKKRFECRLHECCREVQIQVE
jgi:hypothetical protein